jgi:AraC-like DNA-binding protein
MSQIGFEEALGRLGMEVRGGNMMRARWSTGTEGETVGNIAWAGRNMGILVADWVSKTVTVETLARKDLVVCTAVLNLDGVRTYAVGGSHFETRGADMSLLFVPRHERLQCVANVPPRGIKAVTVVVDLMNMLDASGVAAAALPRSLLRTIKGRQIAMETLASGYFGEIARGIAARQAMFPSLAPVYYEGKTLQLVSALLSGLSRRDALRAGDGAFDPRTLERLNLVKQSIDQGSDQLLDVDALARVAAMNRTQLRSAFKQIYGTTLSGYRTALMLQRAERAIKQRGFTVRQAAQLAGYATASSFITAYKRQYGVSPGTTRHTKC